MTPPIENMPLLGELLRCPTGEKAVAVGNYMFEQNNEMIQQTLCCLPLLPHSRMLEIGFGNGKHLPFLFSKAPDAQYVGLETSAAMVTEALANNATRVQSGQASFFQVEVNGNLSLNSHFNLCFMVNTIYFIPDLQHYLAQLRTFLTPQATIALTFIDKAIGIKLPFAQQVFRFYTADEVLLQLQQVGFTSVTKHPFQQEMQTAKGKKITRYYWVVTGVNAISSSEPIPVLPKQPM